MSTSMKLKTNKDIIKLVEQNLFLFRCFTKVFLFGSLLDDERIPNDIDILLVYVTYTDEIKDEIINISSVLESVCGLAVDLTVLSIDEENDTGFLQKIEPKCLRLK